MTEKSPIVVTPSAVNKVKQLITEEGDPSLRLRVYIVGGGCAGLQYGFAFDSKQNADDFIIEHENTGFVVDSMSLQYLMGSTVDYIENLQGSHFVVNNPNANTTCGCGSSFSV